MTSLWRRCQVKVMSLLVDSKLPAAYTGGLSPSPGLAVAGPPAAADHERSRLAGALPCEMALSGRLAQGRELFQPA